MNNVVNNIRINHELSARYRTVIDGLKLFTFKKECDGDFMLKLRGRKRNKKSLMILETDNGFTAIYKKTPKGFQSIFRSKVLNKLG